MSIKNVAIIGSNGFIGSHLARKLRQLPGINLCLFGRNESSVFGNELPYTQLDLRDTGKIKEQFSKIDFIYYLASETIPSTSWENPVIEIEKNLLPFINFLSAIASTNVKKVIFISSGGTVYGATEKKVNEESGAHPFSPYGINKLTMEYYLNYFRTKHNIHYDVYRPSNVYGEGQNTGKGIGIINTFLESITTRNEINIFGDGENVRNFLYVQDLAEIITLSLFSDAAKSETYNVSSNDTLSLNELVATMKQAVDEDFKVIHTQARQSDNSSIYLDNSKLMSAIPSLKMTPLEEGIRKTYLHIKKQLPASQKA